MAEKLDTAEPREKLHRRWIKFRLRTLLLFVTLAGSGFGWLGFKIRECRRQQAAVAALEKLGRGVTYDYEIDPQGEYLLHATPPGASWLHALLGDDFFRTTNRVSLYELPVDLAPNEDVLEILEGLPHLKELDLHCTQDGLVTDDRLEHIEGMTQLQRLDLESTKVTDAGLDHLKGLVRLKELNLCDTKVTDVGVAKLQAELPNCYIGR